MSSWQKYFSKINFSWYKYPEVHRHTFPNSGHDAAVQWIVLVSVGFNQKDTCGLFPVAVSTSSRRNILIATYKHFILVHNSPYNEKYQRGFDSGISSQIFSSFLCSCSLKVYLWQFDMSITLIFWPCNIRLSQYKYPSK